MSIIGRYGYKSGNPYRLLGPINDQGQVCGYDVPEKYFYPVSIIGSGVCVSSCPTVSAKNTSSNYVSDYYCLSQFNDVVNTATATIGQTAGKCLVCLFVVA